MEIRKVPGTEGLERGDPPWWRRFDLSWWQDWAGVLMPHRHNWSDFTLIHASAEGEWYMGNANLHFALLGFHLQLTYYWPKDEREKLKATVRLWEAGMLETKPAPTAAQAAVAETGITQIDVPTRLDVVRSEDRERLERIRSLRLAGDEVADDYTETERQKPHQNLHIQPKIDPKSTDPA